jgi:hypothetical protein
VKDTVAFPAPVAGLEMIRVAPDDENTLSQRYCQAPGRHSGLDVRSCRFKDWFNQRWTV